MAGEHDLLAVLAERDCVERIFSRALLHSRRSDRHASDSDANDRRLVFQEPLDVVGRHMSLDDVVAENRGMAGLQRVRYSCLILGAAQL